MSANETIQNEINRLSSYNKKGCSEIGKINSKRTIKTPSLLTYPTLYRKPKATKKQTTKKLTSKQQASKIKLNKMAETYWIKNGIKHEPYISDLLELLIELEGYK